MIEDFMTHTGTKESIVHTNVVECVEALPQYHVGHHLLVEEVEKLSPSWLSVSGQSFYLSGIPNCVIRSRDLISKLYHDKVLKNPLL
jgi:protoporphyrinogen oxidase